MQKKVIALLGLFLAESFLSGCLSVSNFPLQSTGYLRQKVETALSSENDPPLAKILCARVFSKRYAVIKLNPSQEEAETRCRKVIRALARDPLLPEVDEFCVKIDVYGGTLRVETSVPLAPVVVPDYRSLGIKDSGFVVSLPPMQSTRYIDVRKTVFALLIPREQLLRGEEPRVVIRNGIYVSGPMTGQSSNDLFLIQ